MGGDEKLVMKIMIAIALSVFCFNGARMLICKSQPGMDSDSCIHEIMGDGP